MKRVAQWAVLGVVCVSLGLFRTAPPAFSQQSPPASDALWSQRDAVAVARQLIVGAGSELV